MIIKVKSYGLGSHSQLMSEPGFNPKQSDFKTHPVNLYSTVGGPSVCPFGATVSYTREGRSVFLLGNCFTQCVSWPSLPKKNSAGTKNDFRILWKLKMILVSFRGKPVFLISSQKILRVVLCSILDSLYSGHILTKKEGSALPPWLFTLEAALGSAIVTILPHHLQMITEDLPMCQVLATPQPTW